MYKKLVCFVLSSLLLLMSTSFSMASSVFIYDFQTSPIRTVGADYYEEILVSVYGTYVRSWVLTGNVPPGFTLRPAPSLESAQLSGRCTQPGSWLFGIRVYATNGDWSERTVHLIVKDDKPEITGTLQEGLVGENYSSSLKTGNGTAPYMWLKTSGDLPPGLSLNTFGDKAEISGTPTKEGTYNFEISVIDSAGKTGTKQFSMRIRPLIIEGSLSEDVMTASEYLCDLSVRGGAAPFLWEVCDGTLPPGLTLTTIGARGRISGTPPLESEGTYNFTLRVTDANYGKEEKQFTIDVNTISIIDSGWSEDGDYESQSYTVENGTPPYTWKVIGGSLPPGKSLEVHDDEAVVSCVKYSAKTAVYNYTLGVTDALGRTAEYSDQYEIDKLTELSIHTYHDDLPQQTSFYNFVNGGLDYASYREEVYAYGNHNDGDTKAFPYTWSLVAGSLPPNMRLCESDTYDVEIEGDRYSLPYHVGPQDYSFILKVVDAYGTSARKKFTIRVEGDYSLPHEYHNAEPDYTDPIISGDFADSNIGTEYFRTVSAFDGTPPYTWSIVEGKIPDGLILTCSDSESDAGTGMTGKYAHLSGQFTKSGCSYEFRLKVTDAGGNTNAKLFLVSSFQSPTIKGKLPNGAVGKNYTGTLKAYGGMKPATWSSSYGSLPTGLTATVSGDLVIVSGTPTKEGQFKFNLIATNSAGVASKDFVINVATQPKISSATLGKITVGKPYRYQLKASGTAPILWNCDAGLPEGLILMTTGVISGSPMIEGKHSITVTASNTAGTDTKTFTLQTYIPVSITTSSLEKATDGKSYSVTLQAKGTAPIAWTAKGLPVGLSINKNTGEISGKPTQYGTFTVNVTASNAYGKNSKALMLTVVAPPSITTTSLSKGTLKKSYNVTLKATGTAPITWAAKGLPTGLSINKTTGKISGKPTQYGTFTVKITASNAYGNSTKTLKMTVVAPPSITTTSLNVGTKGKNYSVILKATGTTPITWTVKGLPTGLSINKTTGKISGKPTQYGTFTVKITASNAYGNSTKTLKMTVVAPPSITTTSLSKGTLKKSYSVTLKATGTAPITWTAKGLPAGLSINKTTGKISGKPTQYGTFTVNVTASNAYGKNTKALKLTVVAPPSITTASLSNATLKKSYSVTLKATGTAPITWTAKGLPAGLSINKTTGKISGKPTKYGTFTVNVTATNAYGKNTKAIMLTIVAPPTITTTSLSNGTLKKNYSVTLKATGTVPITWTAKGLPAGLSINKGTGKISGMPTKYGTFTVSVTASNVCGNSTKSLTMTVVAPPSITTASLNDGTLKKSYSVTIKATGTQSISWTANGLPSGLSLNESTGKISGKPKKCGTFTVSITATNAYGSSTKKFNLNVLEAAEIKTKDAPTDTKSVADDSNGAVEPDTSPESVKAETYSSNPLALKPEMSSQLQLDGYMIAHVFDVISCDTAGMYDFNITLDDEVPEGWKLIWLANSSTPSEDDDIAEFFDREGAPITLVPEDRKITVSVWLNPNNTYEPAIAVMK